MKCPKHIDRPDLTGCEKLTPAQTNEIHFGNTHSVISPEKLEELAAAVKASDKNA